MAKVTLNKDGTPRKKGSGKTKGAGCYAKISWRDLKRFVGTEVPIPVSRVWLRGMGAEVEKYVEAPAEASVSAEAEPEVTEGAEEPILEETVENKEATSPIRSESDTVAEPETEREVESKPELEVEEEGDSDFEELPEPLFADDSLAAKAYRYSQNFDL